MQKTLTLMLCLLTIAATAQVNYTAQDQVIPYNGRFRLGNNPGYYPTWTNRQLADIAAGNHAVGQKGVGSKANRVALSEDVLDVFGYDVSLPDFQHYAALGMQENVALVGGPTGAHRDYTEFCPGVPSRLFANLYLPIWDGGANGTPYNDDNYFAAYMYKIVSIYKDQVRFWEIWNEPGLDITFNIGWRDENYPGNWFAEGPDPCDNIMHAPIYYYIRTLRIAWEVIKTVAPDDYVCLGSVGYQSFMNALLTNTDNPNGGDVSGDYPLTGGAYFDAISYHSYPHIDGSTAFYDSGFFDRNSDRAADGLINYQNYYKVILDRYGYNGSVYPAKEWIVTEVNSPRKTFGLAFPDKPINVGPAFGGNNEQVNHMMKVYMIAKINKIHQLHPYQLIDERTEAAADYEFQLMGMYKNLQGAGPYNVQINDEGKAMKTMSDLLHDTEFDESRSNQMNVPQGARGYAWRRPDGSYIYAVWARTTIDLSEEASAIYSFPAGFNLNTVVKYDWDYGYSNSTQTISSQNIALNARPLFFTAGSGGLQCSLSANVTNIQCNNNGTANNNSDDTFTFSVTVNKAGNCGSTWIGEGTTGTYGIAKTFGPFPIATGNRTLTFLDAANNTFTTTVTANAPAPCSGIVVNTCENNVLQNSSLESGLNAWEGNGQTTNDARTGNSALQVCQNGSNARQTRSAQAGKTYTLQAFAKRDDGVNGVIGIKFLSSSWQPLLQSYEGINSSSYTQISISEIAPGGTAYVEVSMIKDGGNGCVYTDDWCLSDDEIINNDCELSATVENILCNNNNTPGNDADDLFTFNVRVFSSGACSDAWSGEGRSGDYGTGYTFGPYPISSGNKTLNFRDADNPNVTVSITATPPIPCSGGTEEKPDLRMANLNGLPAFAKQGETINWTFDLINSGNLLASGEYPINIILSTDANIGNSDDQNIGSILTGNTPIGTISGVQGAITIPGNINPGAYFLILNADPFNVIAESNESNNFISGNITIEDDDGGGEGVDLELLATTTNNAPPQWTFFSVNFIVSNTGDENASNVQVQIPSPDGIVLKGGDEYVASQGSFQTFGNFEWNVGTLAANSSATLTLNYFNLSTSAISIFGQVSNLAEADIDSAPNNNNTLTPMEDDEAVIVINANAAAIRQGDENEKTINQWASLQILNTYPNLTSRNVNIVLNSTKETDIKLSLIDNNGRALLKKKVALRKGINEIKLDATPFASGMYHVLLLPDEGGRPLMTRFVKQNL